MTEQKDNVVPLNPPNSTMDAKERTVKAFVLVHSLLADGLFPGRLSLKLAEARGFIEAVHAEALKFLEADPEFQAKQKKEKEDGNQAPEGTPPQAPTS